MLRNMQFETELILPAIDLFMYSICFAAAKLRPLMIFLRRWDVYFILLLFYKSSRKNRLLALFPAGTELDTWVRNNRYNRLAGRGPRGHQPLGSFGLFFSKLLDEVIGPRFELGRARSAVEVVRFRGRCARLGRLGWWWGFREWGEAIELSPPMAITYVNG
jgi:hypothetical protein